MRAEARVLNLGRTSWHYDGGRRAAAARPPQSRWGARVSKRVAGRAMPDFSEASPTPRMPAVLSRESSPKPRPVSTVPEWSRLGGTHSRPGARLHPGSCFPGLRGVPPRGSVWYMDIRGRGGVSFRLLSRRPVGRTGRTAPVDVASYIVAVQPVAHQPTLSTPCLTSAVIGTCRGWSGR